MGRNGDVYGRGFLVPPSRVYLGHLYRILVHHRIPEFKTCQLAPSWCTVEERRMMEIWNRSRGAPFVWRGGVGGGGAPKVQPKV
eukprot:1148502-Pelagomonas_calceolata.AAC.4